MTGVPDVRGDFSIDPRKSIEDYKAAKAIEGKTPEEANQPGVDTQAQDTADKVDVSNLKTSQELTQEFESLKQRLMASGKPGVSWVDETTGAKCNLLAYQVPPKTGPIKYVYTRENDEVVPPEKTMTVYQENNEGGITGKQFLHFKKMGDDWKQIREAGKSVDEKGELKKDENTEAKPMQENFTKGFEEIKKAVKTVEANVKPTEVAPQPEEQSLILRDAKPNEVNKSEDGKNVVYNGKVLDVPYISFGEAQQKLLNSVTATMNGPDGLAKDFLKTSLEQANKKLGELLLKPEYAKYKKENIEELAKTNPQEAEKLKNEKKAMFAYILSEAIVYNSNGKDLNTVPKELLFSALQTRSAALEEAATEK